MEPFVWVSNPKKFFRAIEELKKINKEVTEANIKEQYLKYGGLVIGEVDTQRGVEEGAVMTPVTGKPPEIKKKKALR